MFTCTFSFNKVDMITEIDKYNAQTGKWEYVGNGARWESYLSVTPTTEWNQLWFSHDFYVTGLRVRSMSWGAVLPVGSNQWYWSTVGYGLILVTQ